MSRINHTGTGVLYFNSIEFSLVKKLLDQPLEPKVTSWFGSKVLESYYTDRGLGFMLKAFKDYHSFLCILAIYSRTVFNIPLHVLCSPSIAKEDLTANNKHHVFSTDKIFANVKQCSGSKNPFPYGGTTDDDKCQVAKVLPLMSALLWYKITDFMANSLCHNSLEELRSLLFQQNAGDQDHVNDNNSLHQYFALVRFL